MFRTYVYMKISESPNPGIDTAIGKKHDLKSVTWYVQYKTNAVCICPVFSFKEKNSKHIKILFFKNIETLL